MPNYNKSYLYTIYSPTLGVDKQYIGATTKSYASKILHNEKYKYKKFLEGKQGYKKVFDILEYKDACIRMLDMCPCNSKKELNEILRKYIEITECINKDKYKPNVSNTIKDIMEKINTEKKDKIDKLKIYDRKGNYWIITPSFYPCSEEDIIKVVRAINDKMEKDRNEYDKMSYYYYNKFNVSKQTNDFIKVFKNALSYHILTHKVEGDVKKLPTTQTIINRINKKYGNTRPYNREVDIYENKKEEKLLKDELPIKKKIVRLKKEEDEDDEDELNYLYKIGAVDVVEEEEKNHNDIIEELKETIMPNIEKVGHIIEEIKQLRDVEDGSLYYIITQIDDLLDNGLQEIELMREIINEVDIKDKSFDDEKNLNGLMDETYDLSRILKDVAYTIKGEIRDRM